MGKLIGLDIGTTAIKLVELDRTDKTNKLISAGLSPMPAKGSSSEGPADQAAVVEVVRKTMADAKVSSKNVNIALPENLVFTRVIEMPALSEKELVSAIRWEAEQYVPFPLTDVILDYWVIDQGGTGKTGLTMRIFLAAAPKTLVAKYEKIVQLAGLELVAIETESLALHRALIGENPSSPVTMLISIGADHTVVFVSSGANIMVTHTIANGSRAFTRALASDLGIDTMQAEEYKKTHGIEKDLLSGKIGDGVKPVLEQLVAELKRVISFYQGKNTEIEPIRRAVLVSGGAKLPGLVVFLTDNLGIETQIGDPWQKISDTQRLANQPFDPILFSEAVGLALRPL